MAIPGTSAPAIRAAANAASSGSVATSPIKREQKNEMFFPVTAMTIHYGEELEQAPQEIKEAKNKFCDTNFTVPQDFKAPNNPFSF